MDDAYRKFLLKTILFLEETSGNLFAQILNLASHNELPMLRENFEDQEIFNFNIKMFDESEDLNVIRLVRLYKKIERQRNKILVENNITEEEMNRFYLNSEISLDEGIGNRNEDLFGEFPMSLN